MNEELYLEILNEAETLFKKYNSGIKGQQLTVSDGLDYWIVMVAHSKGFKDGYEDCYQNGTTILDED